MLNIFREVQEADQRIRSYVRTTPLVPAPSLSALSSSNVYLKLENLQHTGSFKVRGAFNSLMSLSENERLKGVVTASSGNHGLAVAFALKKLGIPGTIFLPENVAPVKYAKLQEYDVQIKLIQGEGIQVESTAIHYATQQNMHYISPYNDARVIGGQGTIGVELHDQQQNIDCLFVAVGGGGMVSGIAGYLKEINPGIRIIGCEPQNSQAMSASVTAGHIVEIEVFDTLSDGTAGGIEPGSITFEPCARLVDEWVNVSETEIAEGMHWVFKHEGLVIEGAAGVVVAAYLKRAKELPGSCAALVMCGANIDEEKFKLIISENKKGEMSRKTNIHAFVSGRVQGVFYRASLAEEAKRLHLTGFVRNLSDGRVEFLAFGEQLAIDALKRWSYTGPPIASVASVEIVAYSGNETFDEFTIEY